MRAHGSRCAYELLAWRCVCVCKEWTIPSFGHNVRTDNPFHVLAFTVCLQTAAVCSFVLALPATLICYIASLGLIFFPFTALFMLAYIVYM